MIEHRKLFGRRTVTVFAGLVCTAATLVGPLPIASASTPQVAKAKPAICKYLDDQAGSKTFLTAVAKDIKAKNVKALQALLLSLVDDVETMSTSSAVRSTPAAVQAAIKTVAHSDLGIKTQIGKTTTIAELLKVLENMGKAPGVQGAEKVIGNYSDSVCGG
jgi:hypothetical protein